ncbi:hypothetical protein CEXT_109901 [Caerostris extrusa]|uniref:Maturase K n=1 Tax=Caerostris extrusa TaxID=172846 RepID=A0AAV4XE86_CAEEX|nr:hypothetical protein CEXT_109901 [Caerostris extrusa]
MDEGHSSKTLLELFWQLREEQVVMVSRRIGDFFDYSFSIRVGFVYNLHFLFTSGFNIPLLRLVRSLLTLFEILYINRSDRDRIH